MTKEIHEQQHNSKTNPLPTCEWCKREVRRRIMRCYGEGMSTVPQPRKDSN